MPTLAERLKSLGVKVGAQELPPPRPHPTHPIEEVLPGRFTGTTSGQTYVVETVYAAEYQHGRYGLQTNAVLQTIAEWSGEPRVAQLPPQAFAFLDTETSGLAGGTGTYAFLVGIGRFSEAGFTLAQFFLRDHSRKALFTARHRRISGSLPGNRYLQRQIVRHPLLNTALPCKVGKRPSAPCPTLDLLHLARRLWRDRLPSRTLANLEVQVLGTERTDEEIGLDDPSNVF
jgi:uncharacterized protein YprB with RNaseH-like and TPR domain